MSTSTPGQPSSDGGEPTHGAAAPAQDWQDLCSLEEIPEGGILTLLQGGQNLLVHRNGKQVTCMPNECPHRGWPLDGAFVRDGILMCPYHGYEFRLATGECITEPDMPLDMFPIRIRDGRVDVRLK